ncbi:TIGR00282 family metallophosphoesterase [Pelagibacterium sp.]|uniref:TIGR00282 family metallophosphoesterase n=1 Tax=Pelagibacterium sp. TaxID=1967288 RepID=UPI003A900A69
MRLLFLGDVMGRAGRDVVTEKLPDLIERFGFDFVIVNGENASHGRGITEAHYEIMRDAGADVVTLGDHAFDQRELMTAIERHDTLIRPINFPPGAPGRGATMVTGRKGHQVLVVNALGRVFMPPMDDPFRAVDNAIARCPLGEQADAIVVDFHAEATSEMQGMGHYLDGRVSLVVGTHTHIPTSDHRILRGGTGLMSDAGMCGDYDSVIGMEPEEPLNRFVTGLATARFTPSEGEATLCGVAIETDRGTGLCRQILPVRIGGALSQAYPDFS